ncbi:MAG: T9SS type A sorting domain-containing protein [Bacteroidetes bacterium]|nr:T9SS type A sorting domain-containing protein [Bacteroidota bacterium]
MIENYLNPFNPTTTINYKIPELSFVTLKVYDVLGIEIATLVNEDKAVGSYEVEFDGSELTSGIYFYRLQAGSFFETKKMVLMK